jgi:integrase
MYNLRLQYQNMPINLQYRHLTVDEIDFLYNCDKNLSAKIKSYEKFKSKYKDLQKFEKECNKELLNENKNNDNFPHWYIMRLVEYGRIHLELETLLDIRLLRKNFLDKESRLINLDFFSDFQEAAIKLDYNKHSIEKVYTVEMIKIMIYMQGMYEDLPNKLNEYKILVEEKVSKGLLDKYHRERLLAIASILAKMGYDIDVSDYKNNKIINHNEELREDFTKALGLYKDYLNSHSYSYSYCKTEISHNRIFLRYISKIHEEVDDFTKLDNNHFKNFIEYQKKEANYKGENNEYNSINKRINAINRMAKFLRSKEGYKISENFITKYDRLKVPITFPKNISEDEITNLIKIILNDDQNESIEQYKAIITICMDTGRRIHEVLLLGYDCYENGQVYFHKTKKGKANWQVVGEATEKAILTLKKYASKIKSPIYSKIDGLNIRRLAPSRKYKGRTIIASSTVSKYFESLQIQYGLINKEGKPKYKPHDLKRIFISSLSNSGVSPTGIAKFMDQNINNIVPYEISNKVPIETLRKVEEKGLLIGNGYEAKSSSSKIYNLLDDVDVIKRNAVNMISKINNPSEVLPLYLGECVDNISFEMCGDLICIACNEFVPTSVEEFNNYVVKMYKYIYKYKRSKNVTKIEKKLYKSLEHAYVKFENIKELQFNKAISKLKKIARREIENE